jgi:hypothetical protein
VVALRGIYIHETDAKFILDRFCSYVRVRNGFLAPAPAIAETVPLITIGPLTDVPSPRQHLVAPGPAPNPDVHPGLASAGRVPAECGCGDRRVAAADAHDERRRDLAA